FVLEAGEYAGPLVAQGKRLTVVGDAAGKTVIAGTEKFAGAVVVADAKADLTLADVGFRTVNDKQAAVMVRQSSARLVGCRFESLKDYAVYVEGGDVIVSRGTFTAVASLGVAAFKGSTVRVFESTFSDGKRSALHAQDGSTLAVEACRFGKLREAAVVGLKGSTVRVHGSRFDAVANAAIAVQGASLAVIRHNAFSACRAVADCDGTAELIVSGNTVDGGPEDDGVRLRPAGPTAITDNAFRGVQTAVAVTGATSAPVAIARNTAVSMRRGGIYLSGGSEGVTARLYHNRILGFPKVGLLLDEEVRAVMVGNAVIADAGEAMAASIQNGASILASGNILVADQAAASFYQSDAAVSRFDDDLLFGPVLAGDRRPLLGPMTRRLDVLLREDAARAELATAVEEYRSQPADRRDSALS
ncbi:MAG: right-handed parallel beta-helix repeat-containing protein, partial [Bauldia sp.]